tara:strand:+ start:2834 stop:3772 length:939 start_codon:yes stop_codon:yes gene_type:complete
MITLNQIAYNIQDLMYPNTLTLEGEAPIAQIKHWIHYHRAKLIEENVSKGILSNNNLYQRTTLTKTPIAYDGVDTDTIIHEGYQTNPILNFTMDHLDFYGRKISKTQDRGDWRNLGYVPLNMPEIINLPNDIGLTINMSRRVHDKVGSMSSSKPPKLIALYRKSIAEKNFGDFNKFTKNDKPYYTVERQMSIYNPISPNHLSHNARLNGNTLVMVNGLQISPNNYGDLEMPAGEDIIFAYRFFINFILQDPTQIEEDVGGFWSHEGGGQGEFQKFDDDTTPYPIPSQYVKDLIERVVAVEGNTVLKTMQNES